MKQAVLSALIFGLAFLSPASSEPAQFAPIYPNGAPPDRADWIRIQWLGEVTHPISPVFFLAKPFQRKPRDLAGYVFVTATTYDQLAKFTRSLRCSPETSDRNHP